MAKYLNRLKSRLAMQRLVESAKEGKNWIVSKKLILETEEGELALDAGDSVEIGANDNGDMVVGSKAAVVIITEPEIAEQVADAVVNADELSDVEFVTKDALDALNDGEPLDDVVDALGDETTEEGQIEVPEVSAEKKESVEAKYAKFSENRMNPAKAIVCESILVEEDASERLNLFSIKTFGTFKESFNDYAKFVARVSELNGSIQPGKREIALNEAGEVMGAYDTEMNDGEIYSDNSFETVEEMDSFEDEPMSIMADEAFEGEEWDMEPVEEYEDDMLESCLKAYEESARTGADYMKLAESLADNKLGLKESAVAKIVSTFNTRSLKECCRVYDSKYGKYVAAFKESVDASNFIAETNVEKRFTKRFFN
jgi:hypothetical protein